MKKFLLSFFLLSSFILVGCSSETTTNTTATIEPSSSSQTQQREPVFVNIKYRSDPVDVAGFEYLNTASSSLVRGAWYDVSEEYMIINLNGVNYHYCEFPELVWSDFRSTSSFGTYYNRFIKGNYDCRYNYLPSY